MLVTDMWGQHKEVKNAVMQVKEYLGNMCRSVDHESVYGSVRGAAPFDEQFLKEMKESYLNLADQCTKYLEGKIPIQQLIEYFIIKNHKGALLDIIDCLPVKTAKMYGLVKYCKKLHDSDNEDDN